MTQAGILEWLVPLVMLMFGAIFLAVHIQTSAALWWSISYFLLAAAFALDIVQSGDFPTLKAVAGDALFVLALIASARAVSLRYGRAPRDAAMLGYFSVSVAAITLVLQTTGSVSAELVASHLACAGLQIFAAIQMRGRMKRGIDRVIFALIILIAADLMLRSAAFSLLTAETITFASWRSSDFAFAFQTSTSLLGLFFALAVLHAIWLDVIAALQLRSQTDPMTGVLNRCGFTQRCAELLAGTSRRPFNAVIAADIDHFKRVNDEFGHAAGDAVIAGFAAVLARLAGTDGCVGRLGGEEFAVLLTGKDLAGATAVAEAARIAFSVPQPAGASLTASFGVAELRAGEPLERALERADGRLYRAKNAGRNRVVGAILPPALAEAA